MFACHGTKTKWHFEIGKKKLPVTTQARMQSTCAQGGCGAIAWKGGIMLAEYISTHPMKVIHSRHSSWATVTAVSWISSGTCFAQLRQRKTVCYDMRHLHLAHCMEPVL